MRAQVLGIAVAVMVFAPGIARAQLVGSASDSGKAPFADANGELTNPRTTVRLVVSTRAPQAVDIDIDLQCRREVLDGPTRKRSASYALPTQAAPLERQIRLPMKRATWCHVDVDAGYHFVTDQEYEALQGEIAVQIFGSSRPPGSS